jgi:hypothetical protein
MTTSKEAAVKPQEVPAPKTVTVAVYLLTIALTFFATAVIVTIANWFLYGSIHSDARSAVITDMKIVSKAQEQ